MSAGYELAMRQALSATASALADVNAARPRTVYPWHRRLWWRLTGTPSAIRAAQLAERKERAALMCASLREHYRPSEPPVA